MHISWLGDTGLKVQVKPQEEDITVLFDPYQQKEGTFPRNLQADIVLYTHGEDGSITISGTPFILSTPGECETKNVLITSMQAHEQGELVMRIDAEDLSLGHLGKLRKAPTNAHIGMLSGVDILCVPIGGKDCLTPEEATKAVNAIEPRIVIPIAAKSDNNPDYADVLSFVKHLGLPAPEAEKKVIIKQKSLPQEEMQLVILTKE